eukprot:Awhi_evm1s14942
MNLFKSKKVFSCSQLNNSLQRTILSVAYDYFTTGRRCKYHHHVRQEKIKRDSKNANHSNTNNGDLKIENKLSKKGYHNISYNKKKSTKEKEPRQTSAKIDLHSRNDRRNDRHQLQVYLKNYENHLSSCKLEKNGEIRVEGELKQHQNALNAYLAIKNPKAALNIFKKIESKQRIHDSNRQSFQILKSLLQVNGQQQGIYFFDWLHKFHPLYCDVYKWTVLINGLMKKREVELSLKYFKDMKQKGLPPNVVTYTSLIDGFSKKGDMKESLKYFKEMKQKGISPNVVTYNCLIDGF